MGSSFGNNIKFTVWGQSHSPAIGITVDGLPAGINIDFERLQKFMDRRRPGGVVVSTARNEADAPEFLSGVKGNVICGAPLCAVIKNIDCRSHDYDELQNLPRPGHADFTAHIKYNGYEDAAGGGHFSRRLTAPICILGGIVLQILEQKGITVKTNIKSIGTCSGSPEEMLAEVAKARAEGDSVGGVVECVINGVPAGIGSPMLDSLESRISHLVFGIPAVRGVEFGAGFAAAEMRGSQNNDEFYFDGDTVKTRTNNHGGILGGISSGMPIVFRTAFKPTPSIAKRQKTVNTEKQCDDEISIKGRHDPCIVYRALPVIESAAAIVIYDELLENEKNGGNNNGN